MSRAATGWLWSNGAAVQAKLPNLRQAGTWLQYAMLLRFADLADDRDGWLPVYVSSATLAAELGVNRRTCDTVRYAWVKAGLLQDSGRRRRGGAVVYALRLDAMGCDLGGPPPAPGSAQVLGYPSDRGQAGTGPVTGVGTGGATGIPQYEQNGTDKQGASDADSPGRTVPDGGAKSSTAPTGSPAVAGELRRRALDQAKALRLRVTVAKVQQAAELVSSWLPLLALDSPSDDLDTAALQVLYKATGEQRAQPSSHRWRAVLDRYAPPPQAAAGQ